MAQISAKQIIRQGNLEDLPILSAGELGYATDVSRLFIGSDASKYSLWTQTASQDQTEFNFGVDLDLVPGEAYRILVNDSDHNFTVNNFVVTFATPLDEGDVVTLELNREILLYHADQGNDQAQSHEITGGILVNEPVTAITYHEDDMNTITLNYSLKDVSDATRYRQGVVRIMLHNDTFTLDDNYTTSVTDTDWDHVFSGTVSSGVFILNVTTTCPNNTILTWVPESFNS